MIYSSLVKSNKKLFLCSLFFGILSIVFVVNIGVGYKLKITATLDHSNKTYFKGDTGIEFLPQIVKKLHINILNKENIKDFKIHYFNCNARGYFTECSGAIYKNISLLNIKKDFELLNKIYKNREINVKKELNIKPNDIEYDDFVKKINFIDEVAAKELYIKETMPFTKMAIEPLPFYKKNYLKMFIYIKAFLLILISFMVTALLVYNISKKIFHLKD